MATLLALEALDVREALCFLCCVAFVAVPRLAAIACLPRLATTARLDRAGIRPSSFAIAFACSSLLASTILALRKQDDDQFHILH